MSLRVYRSHSLKKALRHFDLLISVISVLSVSVSFTCSFSHSSHSKLPSLRNRGCCPWPGTLATVCGFGAGAGGAFGGGLGRTFAGAFAGALAGAAPAALRFNTFKTLKSQNGVQACDSRFLMTRRPFLGLQPQARGKKLRRTNSLASWRVYAQPVGGFAGLVELLPAQCQSFNAKHRSNHGVYNFDGEASNIK